MEKEHLSNGKGTMEAQALYSNEETAVRAFAIIMFRTSYLPFN